MKLKSCVRDLGEQTDQRESRVDTEGPKTPTWAPGCQTKDMLSQPRARYKFEQGGRSVYALL